MYYFQSKCNFFHVTISIDYSINYQSLIEKENNTAYMTKTYIQQLPTTQNIKLCYKIDTIKMLLHKI